MSTPSEDFDQHPDIRTLQGLDGRDVSPPLEARQDLFLASQELYDTQEATEGTSITVGFGGEELKIQKTTDVADKPGKGWVVESTKFGREIGISPGDEIVLTSSTSGSMGESGPPRIKIGQNFEIGKVHRFKSGDEAGVPEQYELFEDPEKLDPAILQANINNGIVERSENGELFWTVVTRITLHDIESVAVKEPANSSIGEHLGSVEAGEQLTALLDHIEDNLPLPSELDEETIGILVDAGIMQDLHDRYIWTIDFRSKLFKKDRKKDS